MSTSGKVAVRPVRVMVGIAIATLALISGAIFFPEVNFSDRAPNLLGAFRLASDNLEQHAPRWDQILDRHVLDCLEGKECEAEYRVCSDALARKGVRITQSQGTALIGGRRIPFGTFNAFHGPRPAKWRMTSFALPSPSMHVCIGRCGDVVSRTEASAPTTYVMEYLGAADSEVASACGQWMNLWPNHSVFSGDVVFTKGETKWKVSSWEMQQRS